MARAKVKTGAPESAKALEAAMTRNQLPAAGDTNGHAAAEQPTLDKPKRRKLKKPEQQTLPGTEVKLDAVGVAANRFVEAIKAVDDATEEKGEAESELLKALKKSKRKSIKVHGYNLNVNHIGPKDKITVQKPK